MSNFFSVHACLYVCECVCICVCMCIYEGVKAHVWQGSEGPKDSIRKRILSFYQVGPRVGSQVGLVSTHCAG